MMAGNSLQGALVAYKASALTNSDFLTALIISGYALGMVVAVFYISSMLQSVGHVRVFAALSAAVSASMLLFPLIEYAVIWFILRFIVGFCYVGLFIVGEAWINASVSSQFRGRVMSLYMMTQFSGIWFGQLSLSFSSEENSSLLFYISSLAISIAAIPLLISNIEAPLKPESKERMKFKQLFHYSPFATVSTVFVSMQQFTLLVALGFFAQKAGLSLHQLSIMGMAVIFAGTMAQWPVARISDRVDRRNVIIFCCSMTVGFAFVGMEILKFGTVTQLYILMCAMAVVILPVYAVNLSHANDLVPPDQAVSAGSTIQLLNAIGLGMGPLVLSIYMNRLGAEGYFIYIMSVASVIVLYALYRKGMRRVIARHHRAVIAPFLQFRSTMRDWIEDEDPDEADAYIDENASDIENPPKEKSLQKLPKKQRKKLRARKKKNRKA